jgi:hypothetical protein
LSIKFGKLGPVKAEIVEIYLQIKIKYARVRVQDIDFWLKKAGS